MKLHYRDFGGTGETLAILHGLFGSSRNWTRVGRALASDLRVCALDLRNHGDSPHDDEHTLDSMAGDLLLWCEEHAPRPLLMGHSMGGLVAMHHTLRHPDSVRALVVVDIAPRSYETGHEREFRALATDVGEMSDRGEIDEAMAKVLPDPAVRRFLQMNLERTSTGYRWKLNRDALERSRYIEGFRTPEGAVYRGPALFVAGSLSPYVEESDHARIRTLFPEARIVTLTGAGHWLHYEAEERFLEEVREFLRRDVFG